VIDRSVQARASSSFGGSARDLSGMVMRQAPSPGLAHKDIARRKRTPVQLLFAQHQRGVSEQQNALIKARNSRRIGV
jgi:hypothetical protein